LISNKTGTILQTISKDKNMEKNCKQCSDAFEVTQSDLDFYKKISPKIGEKTFEIPPPELCPTCRRQRRFAFSNERTLYKRTCDLCRKEIVSIYDKDAKQPVYCPECWWSDKWDSLDYGRDFDFSRPFFEQFAELRDAVPQMGLYVDRNINSEFVNQSGWNKNCYLCFNSDHNEDCCYFTRVYHSKSTLDSYFSYNLELCYECIDCKECFQVMYSQNCNNCYDSWYLYDCINCHDCFCSTGLRNQKFYFLNKKLSEKDYKQKLENFFNGSKEEQKKVIEKFERLKEKQPRKFTIGTSNENTKGDHMFNSKNSEQCFDCMDLEDSKYCTNMRGAKDCYDVDYWGNFSEGSVDCFGIGEGASQMYFCLATWSSSYQNYYCISCNSSQNIFGCVGLTHKKYYILNKQYSKQKYEELAPKIIQKMEETGEWGEFFPVNIASFAYNETAAQPQYPLTKEEVVKRGWKWKEIEDKIPNVKKVIPAERLPDKIRDIPDDILNWAIKCQKTERPYKIQKLELDFYRKMNLPVPRFHPEIRHEIRMKKRNPLKLWKRNCAECEVEIETSYSPERAETVLCGKCYLKEIN